MPREPKTADIPVVTSVTVLRPYLLDIEFSDGEHRCVDVADLLWGEMFEPLREPALFDRAFVDPVLGTVVWPNGADLSPEFLYSRTEVRSS